MIEARGELYVATIQNTSYPSHTWNASTTDNYQRHDSVQVHLHVDHDLHDHTTRLQAVSVKTRGISCSSLVLRPYYKCLPRILVTAPAVTKFGLREPDLFPTSSLSTVGHRGVLHESLRPIMLLNILAYTTNSPEEITETIA